MLTNVYGLTIEEIARNCPSVVATSPHESRSERYLQIPTGDIIAGLLQVDMVPTAVGQAKARDESRLAFTKHILRFRDRADLGKSKPDVHEIVLVNSSDGTSSYRLDSGIFRTVCENGLVVGDIEHSLRVYHRGNIVDNVVEGTLTIVQESQGIMDEVEEMKQIQLSRDEQLLLSEAAMSLRFEQNDEDEAESQPQVLPYTPAHFLRRRRPADYGDDLYTIGNVIQENLIKGKVKAYDARGHKHTTRPIEGIEQSVKLNQALWKLYQGMKELKA